jgi:hypothetical protein
MPSVGRILPMQAQRQLGVFIAPKGFIGERGFPLREGNFGLRFPTAIVRDADQNNDIRQHH